MIVVILAACSADRDTTLDRSHVEKIAKHPNVTITAPRELVGATLVIDASERRIFWSDALIEGKRWTFWRRIFRTPERPPTAAKAYLELSRGKHTLVITHDRYNDIVKTINLGDEHQHVRVGAGELIPKVTSTPLP